VADNPLWQFSLDFYRREGVEGACLELQDRCGLDVNLVLMCCWLGVYGHGVDAPMLAAIEADCDFSEWREQVIVPLRAVRQALKSMTVVEAPVLRRDVAQVELTAEAAAQHRLYALVGDTAGRGGRGSGDAVYTNLVAYLAAAGVDSADESCRTLAAAAVAMIEEEGSQLRSPSRLP